MHRRRSPSRTSASARSSAWRVSPSSCCWPAIALALWLLLEPGLARDAALAVVFIGGVSTLLVNGNPLLRFDGYHVLCDMFELPNLAQRSQRCWQAVWKRAALGRAPETAENARAASVPGWSPMHRCPGCIAAC